MPGIISALLATLLQAAVGLHLAAIVTDWRGEVTRSFLFFLSATALSAAVLAFGVGGLGRLDGVERAVQALYLVPLVLYLLTLASRRRGLRLATGLGAVGLGLIALLLAAVGRPNPLLGPGLTAAAFGLSALALGAGVGGMVLGHWYLTTPNLTSRPLRLLCDLLLTSLVPLSVLAVWYLQSGGSLAGPGGLTGVALWLGVGMITLFPLAVTVAARVCCVDGPGRGRSLQAATGLLYLVAAAVLAGGLAGNAVLLGA